MLEIEYIDFGGDDVDDAELDAADMVNGAGNQQENQPGEDSSSVDDLPLVDECPISPLTDEEKRLEAELKHDQEIHEAKEEHFAFAVSRSNLEAELKEVKASEKAALKHLKNLIRRGPLYQTDESAIDQAVNSADNQLFISVDDPNSDQSWRLVPTAEIIQGIKGIGEKKVDAIIELAPTLGDLEELRAKAGIQHLQFSSVLPKGIGQGMADEIEERILNATKKFMVS